MMGRIALALTLSLLNFTGTAAFRPAPDEFPVARQDWIPAADLRKGLSDEQLLETVQKQTFRFFWHYGHPKTGMARERTGSVRADFYWDYINEANDEPNLSRGRFGPEACALGGTGFGILATVVAAERKWIRREAALDRLILIADFLNKADSFHGIYPHFLNCETGRAIPFDRVDNGGDIVEMSYLMMGFLTAKAYFTERSPKADYLRKRVTQMWEAANWNWYAQSGDGKLHWHWSPRSGYDMNFPVYGWNEALITYVVAASSPKYPIARAVYDKTWVKSQGWKNGRKEFGIRLPLGNYPGGGPLFFTQYTFMGLDPNGLTDDHGVDYLEQVRNHALIHRAYAIANPKKFKGYGANAWGLTAGDSIKGYYAHAPYNDDRGVIQPTAAISSMPFTPQYSMEALRHFHDDLGAKLWTQYGFVDGYSEHHDWWAKTHIAIDQGPIVVMIENHRSGLIWKLFMGIPEIRAGLKKLGFRSANSK